MTWHLIVKTTDAEHRVFIGSDEDARAALAEVQALIGASGPVQVAGQLTLRAEDITAAQIVQRHLEPIRRRRQWG